METTCCSGVSLVFSFFTSCWCLLSVPSSSKCKRCLLLEDDEAAVCTLYVFSCVLCINVWAWGLLTAGSSSKKSISTDMMDSSSSISSTSSLFLLFGSSWTERENLCLCLSDCPGKSSAAESRGGLHVSEVSGGWKLTEDSSVARLGSDIKGSSRKGLIKQTGGCKHVCFISCLCPTMNKGKLIHLTEKNTAHQ